MFGMDKLHFLFIYFFQSLAFLVTLVFVDMCYLPYKVKMHRSSLLEHAPSNGGHCKLE